MAKSKQTSVTRRNSRRRRWASPIPFLSISNPLAGGAIATANCGVGSIHFGSPTKHSSPEFFHLDTVNVTYRSDLARPSLSCWCGAFGRATRKFKADHVSPFNGSALVLLNFSSDTPCWFHLTSESGDCAHISESFLVFPNQRLFSGSQSAITGDPTSSSTTPLSQRLPLLAPRARAARNPRGIQPRSDSFSTGAKAALGVGITLICIAIGAMAGFFYFKRRRRAQDADLANGIIRHDGRAGRLGPDRKRHGASSVASGNSDEPLHTIQPVYDGFPGSMGYDDVRSLHSTTHSHSPTGGLSPTSHNGGFWTQERSIEREELAAARLKSQLNPSAPAVVSYGPNPVTPTIKTPQSTALRDYAASLENSSPDNKKAVPYVSVPLMDYSDYSNYEVPPPVPIPEPKPSPPKQSPALVVSYGPNRVTPTPLVVSPTVPPDEAIFNRRFQEVSPAVSHERQFSWEADSPLLGAAMGPLPPYASTEDFEAMEKGAVRKLAEPQADAELPPTKDGFYHYTSDVVEYELPGAAPQHAPQLPFKPYKMHQQQQGGGSSSGLGGGGTGAGAGWTNREIDEQKFLLDDVEIARMREQKAKARAARAARPPPPVVEEESYDLGEPLYMLSGGSR